MKAINIGIIGAQGKTGQRVMTQLSGLGYQPRALSRSTQPAFDWEQNEGWEAALQGLDTLYVTYHPDLALPRAEEDINKLVLCAKKAGIQHVILLSGRGETGAQQAENVLINSGLQWNVVRASWFMQNFSESFMLDGIKARELVLPEARALEPFIDIDDIAEVVVATFLQDALRNQLFEVTGPELLSFNDCVASIADVIGETIDYHAIPFEDFIQAAVQQGMPADIAWLMNELFTEVLDGRNAWTTDTVQQVLGRPANSFKTYLQKVAATDVWRNVAEHESADETSTSAQEVAAC